MTPRHTVRELRREDAASAADLHIRAFPTFFLALLGPRFLRALYRGFATLPGSVGRVVLDARGDVVAVAAGTLRPDIFFRALLRAEWRPTITAAAVLAVRSPRSVPRLLRAVFYRGGVPLDLEGALLSSICVAPELGGHGLGRRVLAAWQEGVEAGGVTSAYLTTDAVGNDAVLGFYRGAGWTEAGRFETPEGRRMLCLTADLGEAP